MRALPLLLVASCGSLALEPGVGYMTTTGERRQDIPDFVYFELTLVEKQQLPLRWREPDYPTKLWEDYRPPVATEPDDDDGSVQVTGSFGVINFSQEVIKYLLGPFLIGLFYVHRKRKQQQQDDD